MIALQNRAAREERAEASLQYTLVPREEEMFAQRRISEKEQQEGKETNTAQQGTASLTAPGHKARYLWLHTPALPEAK